MSMIDDALNRMTLFNDDGRKSRQAKKAALYYDAFRGDVDALMRTQFHEENYSDLRPMLATHFNLFKKIVNVKAQIYTDQPRRSWITNGKEDEEFARLLGESNIGPAFITLDRYVNIYNVAFIRPIVSPERNQVVFEAIRSEDMMIEQDDFDPTRINAVLRRHYTVQSPGKYTENWSLWTNGYSSIDDKPGVGRFKVYGRDRQLLPDINPSGLNPFIDPETKRSIIPYVPFRVLEDTNDFWLATFNGDLYDGALQVAVDLTHYNNNLKFHGYRQMVVIGKIDTTKLAEKRTDPTTILNVQGGANGQEASVQSLEMTTDPTVHFDGIMRKVQSIADVHGVSFNADFFTRQRQTAEALSINMAQLMELRKERLPIYRAAEETLLWYMVIMANTPTADGGLGKNIDVKGKARIDYQEQRVPMDPAEELNMDLLKVDRGLLSMTDLIMKHNPDIASKEEAFVRLEKIKIDNAIVQGSPAETPEGLSARLNASLAQTLIER